MFRRRLNYFNFKGRARRKEYWMFSLFNLILVFTTMLLDNLLGTTFVTESTNFFNDEIIEINSPYGYIYTLYVVLAFLPGLAVSFRRLHDTGRSAWNFLWFLIPLFGFIWVLILFCKDSQKEENKYGFSPKYRNDESNEK